MTTHWSRLCLAWLRLVFGSHFEKLTPKVRAMRLLEEVLELAQAEEVAVEDANKIMLQVYGKPTGEPWKEMGGVLVTLAIYAGVKNYSLEDCFMQEFGRIMDPKIMEKVRNRNLSGDKIGIRKEDLVLPGDEPLGWPGLR